MVSKWDRQVITHLLNIYYLPGTSKKVSCQVALGCFYGKLKYSGWKMTYWMHVTKNIIWHCDLGVIWNTWNTELRNNTETVSIELKELFAEALWRNGCLSDNVGHLRSHFPIASPRHLLIALRLFQFCGLNPNRTLGSACMDALPGQNGNIYTHNNNLKCNVCIWYAFICVYI